MISAGTQCELEIALLGNHVQVNNEQTASGVITEELVSDHSSKCGIYRPTHSSKCEIYQTLRELTLMNSGRPIPSVHCLLVIKSLPHSALKSLDFM